MIERLANKWNYRIDDHFWANDFAFVFTSLCRCYCFCFSAFILSSSQ